MTHDTRHDATRQKVLDYLEDCLKDDPGIPLDARQDAMALIDDALKDAAANPKPAREVLADWEQTRQSLQEQIEARQRNGEITATDAADLYRGYDEITRNLESMAREEATS